MGNQLKKKYTIGEQNGSGGLGYCFKMYPGVSKNKKEKVTIFLLDKKEYFNKFKIKKRKERKETKVRFLNLLKTGITQQARVKHPTVLSIIPFQEKTFFETNNYLGYITERVMCSLGNLFGVYENLESVSHTISNRSFDALECSLILRDLSHSISFLHKNNIAHLSIAPNCIYITKSDKCKLGGFCFSQTDVKIEFSYDFKLTYPKPSVMQFQPSMDYTAPEIITGKKAHHVSDIFSFGCIMYELFNKSKLFPTKGNLSNMQTKLDSIRNKSSILLKNLPNEFKIHFWEIVQESPNNRKTGSSLIEIEGFRQPLIQIINYLDRINEKEENDIISFLKNLQKFIEKFPKNTIIYRIFPQLCTLLGKENIIKDVLPVLFWVSENILDKQLFHSEFFPQLIPILAINEPISIPLCIIQHLEGIFKKLHKREQKEILVPMIIRLIDSGIKIIQEAIFQRTVSFAAYIDPQLFKKLLLPRITQGCLEIENLSVRVNSIICLNTLLESLTKEEIVTLVIPTIKNLSEIDKRTAIIMVILGLVISISKHPLMDFRTVSQQCLPFLWPLSTSKALNKKQFKSFMSFFKKFINKVEKDRLSEIDSPNIVGSGKTNKMFKQLEKNEINSNNDQSVNSLFENLDSNKTKNNDDDHKITTTTINNHTLKPTSLHTINMEKSKKRPKPEPIKKHNKSKQNLQNTSSNKNNEMKSTYTPPKAYSKTSTKNESSSINSLFSDFTIFENSNSNSTSTSTSTSTTKTKTKTKTNTNTKVEKNEIKNNTNFNINWGEFESSQPKKSTNSNSSPNTLLFPSTTTTSKTNTSTSNDYVFPSTTKTTKTTKTNTSTSNDFLFPSTSSTTRSSSKTNTSTSNDFLFPSTSSTTAKTTKTNTSTSNDFLFPSTTSTTRSSKTNTTNSSNFLFPSNRQSNNSSNSNNKNDLFDGLLISDKKNNNQKQSNSNNYSNLNQNKNQNVSNDIFNSFFDDLNGTNSSTKKNNSNNNNSNLNNDLFF
ncbi:scy1-like protein [Anaeramoeba flamelloides]|uniref:Scy1-like protein n=1 Tax=Anaeramoeba flamelloides TaxID=1746091 RepID=A0ABQ8XJB6_9EUKA|nr:scy1-like protein [Anaeramoeba flamelloides]